MSASNSTGANSSVNAVPKTGPQRVAVVIAARNDRSTIAPTVRACRAIPGVDLIVVVDDGSDDDTAQVARSAGAVAVRHSVPRGRSSALETGAKVAAMRDRVDWPARHILFLDPDLGDSAVEASVLVDAVTSGLADCAVGVTPVQARNPKLRRAAKAGAKLIRAKTGWLSSDSLSTQRCIRRDALNTLAPFWPVTSVDIGMTVDLLAGGFSVVELPCNFEHLEPKEPRKRPRWGKTSINDLWLALQTRRFTSRGLASRLRPEQVQQGIGIPYGASDDVS